MPINSSVKKHAETDQLTFLDKSQDLLLEDCVYDGMYNLNHNLNRLREKTSKENWKQNWLPQILSHSIKDIIHQDPFAFHSYQKPRGYSGDADIIDYIYGEKPISDLSSELGRKISKTTLEHAEACKTVRSRLDILVNKIDDVAQIYSSPKILSIACGHLREADRSIALQEGLVGEFLAFDQDEQSLAFVEERLKDNNKIKTIAGTIRRLIAGRIKFENLDFIYAAGLYDYLEARIATRLTSLIFDMLRPGGRLLIGQFAPDLEGIGYLESFLNWEMVYRNETEVDTLTKDIPQANIAHKNIFRDEYQNAVFLELIKR